MIAKISHGGSLYGVLAYNQIKVDELHADVLFGNRIIEPPGDNPYTIEHISRSFVDYLTANRKTEKPILHISLNPDPKDCVSEEQFIKLAEQYMQRMGFGDQPYIVYRHNDIGREHLHIVSVRVDETGRAISDSYEHERSMKVCRELEQQFDLTPATQKEWKEGLPLSPVDYDSGNLKGQLAGVIRPIAREWRFQSLGEYRAVLSLYGITVDEVKGEYGGREYHGLSYSATDKDGNKVGKPFKSSVFGKEAGITALEKRMLSSAAWVKSHKDIATDTAARIASAMQTAGRDRALFERELMRQGIGVVFRTNDAGRIYGATFIDHADKTVFNGSRLGKEFSANVFNDLFAGQDGIHPPQQSAGVERPAHQQGHTGAAQWNGNGHDTEYHPDHKDSTAQNVADAFSLFAPVQGGASGDQPAPPQRKKKKRRRYGRQQ
ncbi:relaxase/mobilization nuclease domain-containing protein [Parabacteroides distasonis]|uniref:conjugal transfer protein MobB n=1 Tax=Parabacteroides distasonis TaxID=823 RepID=UPI001C38B3F7|nr:conjugal transfer protein MobB [Parabacteroides distasonis]MBV4226714.1 relaxase/mobilization nuclease domain-containing protein [Parabacteroides distasonis]